MKSSTWIQPPSSHHPSAPKLETIKGSSAQSPEPADVVAGGIMVVEAATVEVAPTLVVVGVTAAGPKVIDAVVEAASTGAVVLAPSPAQAAPTIRRLIANMALRINANYLYQPTFLGLCPPTTACSSKSLAPQRAATGQQLRLLGLQSVSLVLTLTSPKGFQRVTLSA